MPTWLEPNSYQTSQQPQLIPNGLVGQILELEMSNIYIGLLILMSQKGTIKIKVGRAHKLELEVIVRGIVPIHSL